MKKETRKICLSIVAGLYFCAMAVAIAMMLSGCQEIEHTESHSDRSAKACVKAGGIPVHAMIGGQFKTCQFPPSKGGV